MEHFAAWIWEGMSIEYVEGRDLKLRKKNEKLANLPTGLYILLALIFLKFFFNLRTIIS